MIHKNLRARKWRDRLLKCSLIRVTYAWHISKHNSYSGLNHISDSHGSICCTPTIRHNICELGQIVFLGIYTISKFWHLCLISLLANLSLFLGSKKWDEHLCINNCVSDCSWTVFNFCLCTQNGEHSRLWLSIHLSPSTTGFTLIIIFVVIPLGSDMAFYTSPSRGQY